jgi:type I restriction enzyme S subunit
MGDIFAIARGGSPRPIDDFLTDDPDGVNWVMISDATESGKYINSTKKRIRQEGVKRSREVKPGDFLLTNSMSFGRPYIMNTSGCVHDGWLVLSPRSRNASPDFFYHLLGSDFVYAEFVRRAAGATVKNLNIDLVKDVQVPLPPLSEQRRIADVLDWAEALRAKRRTALAELDSLTQSIFLDMFGDPVVNSKGWPRVQFGDLLVNIDSGWSPNCLDRPATGDEWGVLKLGAVTRCEYNSAENKALPPDIEPDSSLEVKPGDLLFSRKNTYQLVAACALVRETPPRLLMSDLIFRFRLRPEIKVDSDFLHQLLICPTKRREIQKLAGGSAGSMPNISKARLQTALIEVPPLSLQREFADRVTAVEKLKAAQRASLAELDELFASLQQRAFRGEL